MSMSMPLLDAYEVASQDRYYDELYDYYPDSYGDEDYRDPYLDGYEDICFADDHLDDCSDDYFDYEAAEEALDAFFKSMTPDVRRTSNARLISIGSWWRYWKRGRCKKKETLRSHRDAHSVRKSNRKNFKVKHERFGRVITLNIGEGPRMYAQSYAYMGLVC